MIRYPVSLLNRTRRILTHVYPFSQFSTDQNVNVDFESFESELERNYIEIDQAQKVFLAVGSAVMSLFNPTRPDLINCFAETTSDNALPYMRQKMLDTEEGSAILRDRPRINSKTVDLERLKTLPEGTLGRIYFDFLMDNNVTPDSRLPTEFIKDPDLAYTMLRYRETHDLVHAVLGMKTNMLGEVTVKWVEALQTRLPMCIGAAVFGAARLKTNHRKLYLEQYLPWALETGNNAKYIQGIYYEKRWEQPLEEFYEEMNINPFVLKKDQSTVS